MSDSQNAQSYPPLTCLPAHVGIIMDGNGRWARARGLPRMLGHRAGVENIRRILRAAVEFGVPVLTLYAFSTENWQRPLEEIQGLLQILRETLVKEVDELDQNGVQLRHIGQLDPLSDELKASIQAAIERTRQNQRLILNLAFNYGGRAEIVEAVRRIMREGIPPEEVTEAVISAHLYTAGLPDPDLIIRTSGEVRVSNFLVWQAIYSEYYATPVLWPDFDKDEFYKALSTYSQRNRRFGGVEC